MPQHLERTQTNRLFWRVRPPLHHQWPHQGRNFRCQASKTWTLLFEGKRSQKVAFPTTQNHQETAQTQNTALKYRLEDDRSLQKPKQITEHPASKFGDGRTKANIRWQKERRKTFIEILIGCSMHDWRRRDEADGWHLRLWGVGFLFAGRHSKRRWLQWGLWQDEQSEHVNAHGEGIRDSSLEQSQSYVQRAAFVDGRWRLAHAFHSQSGTQPPMVYFPMTICQSVCLNMSGSKNPQLV